MRLSKRDIVYMLLSTTLVATTIYIAIDMHSIKRDVNDAVNYFEQVRSMIKKELEWDLQEEQTELALKLKAVHG
ncbi:MAG: hypothetical protein WC998_07795 [Candidatus Paceibacterota bacterium]|jgi:hypothetical protein